VTLPGGPDNVNIPDGLPALLFPKSSPGSTQTLSGGYELTQANVELALKNDKVFSNPAVTPVRDAVRDLIAKWPIIGDLVEAITGEEDGDLNDLGTWSNNIMAALGDAITTGNWNSLLTSLFGGTTVGSTVQQSAVPTLPQTKITNLVTDLGDRLLTTVHNVLLTQLYGGTSVLTKLLSANVPSLDATILTTGTVASGRIPNITKSMSTDMATLNDHIANAFYGADNFVGDTLDVAREQMDRLYDMVLQNAQDLTALRTGSTAGQISGKSYSVGLSTAPLGALPSSFLVTYSGGGATPSTFVIKNTTAGGSKAAAWLADAGSTDRTARVEFVEGETNTDYQYVSVVMKSPPDANASPVFSIIGRESSDRQNYIFFDVYTSGSTRYARLGCCVGGTRTTWKSGTFTFNMNLGLRCGVGANDRQFQAVAGNTVILDHTEVGTTSQMGAAYRRGGFITEFKDAGNSSAGGVQSFSLADNAPPDVIGTAAGFVRTSTSAVTLNAGTNDLPTNFWGATRYCSPDIDDDLTNGDFTVTTPGQYKVDAQIFWNASQSALIKLLLRVNGTTVRSWVCAPTARALQGSWVVPLNSGDVVSLATSNSGLSTSTMIGSTDGADTFMDIALVDFRNTTQI
jgi:hypothetical protein